MTWFVHDGDPSWTKKKYRLDCLICGGFELLILNYLKDVFILRKTTMKIIRRKFKWSFYFFVTGVLLTFFLLKIDFLQKVPGPFIILIQFFWLYGLVFWPLLNLKCPHCGERLGPAFFSRGFLGPGLLAALEFGLCRFCRRKIR